MISNRDERINVIGCSISAVTIADTINYIERQAVTNRGGYVCFTNVYVSVLARKDSSYNDIISNSFLTLADGKPIYLVAKRNSKKKIEHIPGPDFLPKFFEADRGDRLKHYFIGGTEEVLTELIKRLTKQYSNANIVGWESPPFRKLSNLEEENVICRITESGANIVWVGLGTPKQDRWMYENSSKLKSAVLLGVGAAFDFHAGACKRAPAWMRKYGLEWLHRLAQEPRRLFKRYMIYNTLFVIYVLIDIVTRKRRN